MIWKIVLLGIAIFGYGVYSYVSVNVQALQTGDNALEVMENTQTTSLAIAWALMLGGGGVIVLGIRSRKKTPTY